MAGRTMTTPEAIEAARAAGYRTPGKSFTVQVNMALIRGPFRREGRGVYTAE